MQRDIFRKEKDIVLPVFPRDFAWWEEGQNMILEQFESAGFHEVPLRLAQPYDVGLFAIRSNGIINHVGVYRGKGIMLHHLMGRLSREDPVEPWTKHLVKLVRHESMM